MLARRFIPRNLIAISAAWICAMGTSGSFQRAAAQDVLSPPQKALWKYRNASDCEQCHRAGPTPEDQGPDGIHRYVRLTEAATWSTVDKHSIAYDVLAKPLENPRTQQMERALHITAKDDVRCLSCHSLNCDDSQTENRAALVRRGVSCQVCHGPGEKWFGEHQKIAWRSKSAQSKESEFGEINLRDPVRRVGLCISCHVGSVEEHKLVTHEMYAAGHPPLPAFEIETYLDLMPRHWVPLKDESPEIQKQFPPDKMQRTRDVMIGAVSGLRESVRLIGNDASARSAHADSPELAVFDCAACHHELTVPSWRQQRGYLVRPGRPSMRGPVVLADLALAASGSESTAYSALSKPFIAAIDDRPFGDPAALALASRELGLHLTEALESARKASLTAAQGLTLAQRMCRIGSTETLDFDSARELAWALRVVYSEVDPKPAGDAAILALLGELSTQLQLDLSSPKPKSAVTDATRPSRVVDFLPQNLLAASRYDPIEFQAEMKKCAALLVVPSRAK